MSRKEYSLEDLMQAGFSVEEIQELFGEQKQQSTKQEENKDSFNVDSLINPAKAAAAGALQGLTYGFGDELLGERAKEEFKKLEEENPLAFSAGDVVGSFLSPDPIGTKIGLLTKIPRLAKTVPRAVETALKGAATGAVAGTLETLGHSEEKTIDEASEGLESGALVGASAATGMDLLTNALPKGIKKTLSSGAKFLIPSASKREQLVDTFEKTLEKAKEGKDFSSKEYALNLTENLKKDTVNFVQNLLESVNKKRQDLYSKVEEIAEKANVSLEADKIKSFLNSIDEMANPGLVKTVEKTLENKDALSYKEIKNLEQKLDKIIESSSQDFITKDAAIQLKSSLKENINALLPEEGKQALKVADDYYKRILGLNPESGEIVGDFYELAGKNLSNLPKYDKAALGDEIVKISDRIISRGTGFKYDPSDLYSSGIRKFDDFLKLANEKDSDVLRQKWDSIKDRLNEQSLVENLFGESFREATPRLSKVDPVGYLTRVGFNTTAAAAKALNKLSPVAEPIYKVLSSLDPQQIERKIAEYEKNGNKGIAEYLRRQYQLMLAETPKSSKLAAQEYVESQNPGLRNLKNKLNEE